MLWGTAVWDCMSIMLGGYSFMGLSACYVVGYISVGLPVMLWGTAVWDCLSAMLWGTAVWDYLPVML